MERKVERCKAPGCGNWTIAEWCKAHRPRGSWAIAAAEKQQAEPATATTDAAGAILARLAGDS